MANMSWKHTKGHSVEKVYSTIFNDLQMCLIVSFIAR